MEQTTSWDRMTSSFLKMDVTAVCLHRSYILAGIGGHVILFDRETRKLLFKTCILIGQKVHGFAWREDHLVVYGGKQLAVCAVKDGNSLHTVCRTECDDWILHVIWTEQGLAALTAHNVLQIWSTDGGEFRQVRRCASDANSILYSGSLVALRGHVVVLAGTVYSHVLLWRSGGTRTHTLVGHKGVIFSIKWDSDQQVIVTTSDDRSVRIWRPSARSTYATDTFEYWDTCNFVCSRVVYGHTSRVMRSVITADMIVSVGEDSNVCFWDLNGKIMKKIKAHQNGCIWSVDGDSTHVLTGGADSAVVLHPLSVARDNAQANILDIDKELGVPKRIFFTARGNLVTFHTNNELWYLDTLSAAWKKVASYDGAYKMLALSSCKQMIAVIDVNGNLEVYLENCKEEPELNKFMTVGTCLRRVCSLHWAGNRLLVVCSEGGCVTVVASDCRQLHRFELPSCRERWLTSVTVNSTQDVFVLGDRCGNVHFYEKTSVKPVKTFRKVHGTYGATSISWKGNIVTTTGRDGTIRYFSVKSTGCVDVTQLHSIKLPFEWVERIIDENATIVCGFNERNFVVHNIQDGRSVIDVTCGGGHRTWDVRRYFKISDGAHREMIKFVYVKDSSVHEATFEMDKITSSTIISGTHVKEINSLNMISIDNDRVLFVAGGEDTTVRVSVYDPLVDTFIDKLIFKQLSSTRAVVCKRLNPNEFLLISGGGRANLCIRIISHNLDVDNGVQVRGEDVVDYQVKGSDSERRRLNIDMDPEMRIMCLDVIETRGSFIIFAGCSDSVLRLFKYQHTTRIFKPVGDITYHKTCILIAHYHESSGHRLLFTATTRGEVCLWDVSALLDAIEGDADVSGFRPVLTLNVSRAGVNSLSVREVDSGWLMATGGDDNAVRLSLLLMSEGEGLNSVREVSRWSDNWHCAQVSGVRLLPRHLLTVSGDQRVSAARVSLRGAGAGCGPARQLCADVSDAQGFDVRDRGDSAVVCVYGKGIQTLELKLP